MTTYAQFMAMSINEILTEIEKHVPLGECDDDPAPGSPRWLMDAACHYEAKCVREILTDNDFPGMYRKGGYTTEEIDCIVHKITPGDPDRPIAMASKENS